MQAVAAGFAVDGCLVIRSYAGRPTIPGVDSVDTRNAGTAAGDDPRGVLLDTGDGRTVTCCRLPDRIGGTDVTVEALRHNSGNAATFGIWRVRGPLGSAVLKVSSPPTAGSVGYWPTSDEPVPRLARFAYELGAGQARWAGRVPPSAWLSRRWLAQYLAEGPSLSVDVQHADRDHPRVAVWPPWVRQELRRLWTGRNRLLAAAEATERTLCHLDVWPANLIDSRGGSVLLDWSFVGEGAVGEDISNLILDSFADGLMDATLLPEVVQTTTDSYLQGLRDGGWSGSQDRVRTAIAACGAAKYSWLAPAVLGRAVRDDLGTSSYGRDRSAGEAVRRVAGLVTLIADWAKAVPV